MRITEQETSSKARWSLRLALFTAQLLIVTVLLHRFASFATPVATNLIVVSLLGAALAILLAVLAFIEIWDSGRSGTGMAFSALLVSLMIYAVPFYNLPNLVGLPAINDITTDLLSPPQFERIRDLREANANSTDYPGPAFIARQAKAYPDIGTFILERSEVDSFELVRNAVADLGWQVVSVSPPKGGNPVGYMEAVDHSMLLGFKDDIVVRVAGDSGLSRIDMRSASRYGRHDLGTNANRIRDLFGLIKTRIARAETKKLDALERERIAKKLNEDRRLRELERKLKQEQQVSEPAILPPAQFGQETVAGAIQTEDPELSEPDPAGARQTRPAGFDSVSVARKTAPASSQQQQSKFSEITQKIQASKRKRKDYWVPFDLP